MRTIEQAADLSNGVEKSASYESATLRFQQAQIQQTGELLNQLELMTHWLQQIAMRLTS